MVMFFAQSILQTSSLSFQTTKLSYGFSSMFNRSSKANRSVVIRCKDESKDTRIYWDSDDEGWLGVPTATDGSLPSSSSSIVQPRGDIISLLAAAPSTHYKFLGVTPNANSEEIKTAYRRLSKQFHPDTTNLPLEVAGEQFILLQEAYTVLINPESRRLYDWKLAQEQSIRGGNDYLWPYEAYKKNMKQNSQSQPKEDKNGNVELSSDAQTALWFDVFALFVALSCVLYVAFVKNKL